MPVIIDPWGALEISDYERLFKEFGLNRFPNKYKKLLKHRFFERNIVIAHRGFENVMRRITAKKPFIQMTGIASSGFLHLGHKADIDLFVFFKLLGAKNYFAVTDIDAYTSRPQVKSMEEAKKYAVDNIAHVLALGVDKKEIYVQSKKEQRYYEFTFELSKKITENMFRAIYGHLDLGKAAANLLQYADILHPQLKEYEGRMPSLTGIGLDQDPHAKITRDLVRRIDYNMELPSFIYFIHQSGLQQGKKMSSSEPDTAIFLNDNENEVKRKIDWAFTGGKDTLKEQKEKGGNPDICKIYEIFKFHHDDSNLIKSIYSKCVKGKLMCKECKNICTNFLVKFLKEHQPRVKKNIKTAKTIVYGGKR